MGSGGRGGACSARSGGVLMCASPHAEANHEATARALRMAMQTIAAPCAVVADLESDERLAITATSVVSCSLDPPLVSFNLHRGSRAAAIFASDAYEPRVGRARLGGPLPAAALNLGPLHTHPTPAQLSICFAGADDEEAVRWYSRAAAGKLAQLRRALSERADVRQLLMTQSDGESRADS